MKAPLGHDYTPGGRRVQEMPSRLVKKGMGRYTCHMDNEERLGSYIEAIARATAGQSIPPTREFFEETARASGFGEGDLVWIEERRKALGKMTEGFLASECWEDALRVIEEARRLSPWDSRLALMQARALYGLSVEMRGDGGVSGDLAKRSARAAREAVQLDPSNRESYAFLASLKEGDAVRTEKLPAAKGGARTARAKSFAIVAVSGILAILIAILVIPQTKSRLPEADRGESVGTVGPSPSIPGTDPESAEDGAMEVPVAFGAGGHSLAWKTALSRLEEYDVAEPAWAYNLSGTLVSPDLALNEVSLRAEFIGTDGKTLFSRPIAALPEHLPTHYPGDRVAVRLLVYEKGTPPRIASVRLIPKLVQGAKRDAPTARPIEVTDDTGHAISSGLLVSLRSAELVGAPGMEYSYVTVVYENVGTRIFTRLRVRVDWRDAGGAQVASNYGWGFIQDDPPLLPGERGTLRIIGTLPPGKAKGSTFAVAVEEAGVE